MKPYNLDVTYIMLLNIHYHNVDMTKVRAYLLNHHNYDGCGKFSSLINDLIKY